MVLSLPWLSGLKVIPFDATQQFFPAVSFVAQQLRQWQAPWWNPYLHSGYPQMADPQMMGFQPSMVLPMLLAPTSLRWFGVVVMLHVLLGGLGALRLARHYGLQALPQLMFAAVMMFGAVAASRLQHTPMIISFAYLPWLWLMLSRLRLRLRWPDAIGAGAFGGLCALQLTQVTYFIILGCAGYAAMCALRATTTQRPRILCQLAAVAGLAALISAPQWVSTLAWLPYTNRSAVTLVESIPGAVGWHTLGTLLSGNVFEQGRGDYWGLGDVSQDYLYMGAVPLALWLGWGGAVLQAQPNRTRIALAVVVLAIAFALGSRTPLFAWLFAWLPGLDLFRRPADALFLTVPMAAWLSAQALQQAITGKRRKLHLPSILVVLAVLAYTLWLVLGADWRPRALAWLLLSAMIGALGLRSASGVAKGSRRAAPMLVALVMLDMLIFNVGTRFNTASASRSTIVSDREGGIQSAYRVLQNTRSTGLPERAAVFGLGALTNGAAVWGLPLVNGYNPMVAAHYARMVGMTGQPLATIGEAAATEWVADFDSPIHDLLGLRWMLAEKPFPGSSAADEHLHMATRESVMPRVMTPQGVRRHAGAFPEPADFAKTDFATTLWLATEDNSACPDAGGGQANVEVLLVQPSHIRLRYRVDAPGWVVINELHAVGWEASAGGTSLPVLRANGLFRAICLPAGAGELVLRYSPWALWKAGVRLHLGRERRRRQEPAGLISVEWQHVDGAGLRIPSNTADHVPAP